MASGEDASIVTGHCFESKMLKTEEVRALEALGDDSEATESYLQDLLRSKSTGEVDEYSILPGKPAFKLGKKSAKKRIGAGVGVGKQKAETQGKSVVVADDDENISGAEGKNNGVDQECISSSVENDECMNNGGGISELLTSSSDQYEGKTVIFDDFSE
mmetsp:Transcript_52521/g.60072  ORF Transcript_52521/g.60072 Transcript_52521/m.60072 type:complete len:159 (+) Transcript_52521:293-769(+)